MIKMHLTGQKISYIKATSLVKNNDYLFNYMHKFCLLSKTNTVTNVHNSISTHTHQCTHACTRTRTHTCTHTHTLTHTQASKQAIICSFTQMGPSRVTYTYTCPADKPTKKEKLQTLFQVSDALPPMFTTTVMALCIQPNLFSAFKMQGK